MNLPDRLTRAQLLELAVKLDTQSGFPDLTPDQSWLARAILGPSRYAMHEAATALWHAASAMSREDSMVVTPANSFLPA